MSPSPKVHRLLPDAAETTLAEQFAMFRPAELAPAERPWLFTNFVVTVDGHATIDGRSGKIGTDTDTALLMGLRESADAVLVGAGTVREENYGRLLPTEERRERRQAAGLDADPLAVIVTRGLNLPWEADLFTSGLGRVLIFTTSDEQGPETATPLEVRVQPGQLDLPAIAAELRREHGVRGLLCEGGPGLHGQLLSAGLVDELFVTLGPLLGGGEGPRLAEHLDVPNGEPVRLELSWLLHDGSELYARYAVRR